LKLNKLKENKIQQRRVAHQCDPKVSGSVNGGEPLADFHIRKLKKMKVGKILYQN
jgi:hypothetical protein